MIKVVFVGDEPSRFNINNDIAFVGARCFERMVEWIKYLSPDYYICINSHTERNLFDIKCLVNSGFKVVGLGRKASERLEKLGIIHFKLPHPSGLNRQLNDKNTVDKALIMCKDYLLDIK